MILIPHERNLQDIRQLHVCTLRRRGRPCADLPGMWRPITESDDVGESQASARMTGQRLFSSVFNNRQHDAPLRPIDPDLHTPNTNGLNARLLLGTGVKRDRKTQGHTHAALPSHEPGRPAHQASRVVCRTADRPYLVHVQRSGAYSDPASVANSTQARPARVAWHHANRRMQCTLCY